MSFFYHIILMRGTKPNEAYKITKLTILIMITVLKNQILLSTFFLCLWIFFLLLKINSIFFLIRCDDVWIFHRLDVLTFRCFCLSMFSHGPSKGFIFDSTKVEAKLSCLFIICLWEQVKFVKMYTLISLML